MSSSGNIMGNILVLDSPVSWKLTPFSKDVIYYCLVSTSLFGRIAFFSIFRDFSGKSSNSAQAILDANMSEPTSREEKERAPKYTDRQATNPTAPR